MNGTRLLFRFALLIAFGISFSAKVMALSPPPEVPVDSEIVQDNGNLSLKKDLEQRRTALLDRYEALKKQKEEYNQNYGGKQFDTDSAEYAAGQQEYAHLSEAIKNYTDDIETFKTDLDKLAHRPAGNLYVDPASFKAYVDKALQKTPVQKTAGYDRAKVQTEINGIRESLKRLDAVRKSNASQSEEWQKASEEATQDAIKSGANLTVDLLTATLKDRADAIDKQLQKQADLLAGETDPVKRGSLQAAFKELADHKEQLEKAHEAAELAHDGVDALETIDKSTDADKPEKLLSTSEQISENLEKAWKICEQNKLLPEGAKEAKAIVDASYDVTVQAVSVERINSLNNQAGQYLKAVTALSQKMKTLVDEQKRHAP